MDHREQAGQTERMAQGGRTDVQRAHMADLKAKFQAQTSAAPSMMTDGPGMINPNFRRDYTEELKNPQDAQRWLSEPVEGRQIWICACRTANIGKFCTECGAPGPRPVIR